MTHDITIYRLPSGKVIITAKDEHGDTAWSHEARGETLHEAVKNFQETSAADGFTVSGFSLDTVVH